KWSKATYAHNSLLINGEGQRQDVVAGGKITSFFNADRWNWLSGDASLAYKEPLQTFRRGILFLRPHTYLIADTLSAKEPSTFSWLLNTFDAPTIDTGRQRMGVRQPRRHLQVDTLLP